MRRYCDGNDPNLLVLGRDLVGDTKPGPETLPCTCGLIFDDIQRSTVWPHVFIDGRAADYPVAYRASARLMGVGVITGSPPPEEKYEKKPKTLGIPPAKDGALQILQFAAPGTHDPTAAGEAAREIASYHSPVGDQAERHELLSEALKDFLCVIVALAPPGAERSTAISRAREAKFWASAAIAMEGR